MRGFWTLAGAVLAATLAGLWLTLATPVGQAISHYNAAFLAIGSLLLLAAPLLRRRRVVTLLMAWSGIVATLTGFAMLYTKQLPAKEWITWWHSVTSALFLGAFVAHWALNHARLAGFARRLARRVRTGAPLAGAWGVGLGLGALTWTPEWRVRFTSENYLYLSSWAVLVGVAAAYGLWLAFRVPRLRARLDDLRARHTMRALVDASLWLSCWLALLTGFALLYFADFLRGGDLKYVSKWWHTATSVAFLALVAIHVGFNARLVAAHARRLDQDLRGRGP